MPGQTEWTKDLPTRNSRVNIEGDGVLVASTCGPGGAEVGAVVSHQEFLDGKYQDVIRKVFGQDVLDQMLVGCKEIIESRQAT
ncbi:MAG: hypothetical protein CL930_03255 [Deltaproteobacteria bacterium]|nr:hypothetical protein [Deltaproteobacteria bacterium]